MKLFLKNLRVNKIEGGHFRNLPYLSTFTGKADALTQLHYLNKNRFCKGNNLFLLVKIVGG